ncbi:nociceptin receptor-like [Oculina patagonica]
MDIFVSVVLYNIIAIGGSLGNTLVLLVIKRTPNLKTACGVLIANLATADLLVTAVAVPLVISVVIQGCVPVCSLDASMLAAIIVGRSSAAASLLILAAMSIDRCWAICNPFQHKIKMTSSKLKTILLFVLLVSLVLPSLEVVFWRQSQLLLEIKHLQIFGVVICYFAIVTSGLVTFINVRCASWKISNLRENGEAGRAELRERNKQVGKTIALVVVAFSICWVPIVFISARFVGHYSALHFWGVLPGFANSAVNPCIYFYRHRSYRQALKGLLRSSHT